jgi:hypothetical protein
MFPVCAIIAQTVTYLFGGHYAVKYLREPSCI